MLHFEPNHHSKSFKKISYGLWKGVPPNLKYFHVFRCKYFILNTKDNLGKFDLKSYEGVFVGYSTTSKAYRVYLKELTSGSGSGSGFALKETKIKYLLISL